MSFSRDHLNALGLLKLLGRVPPPPETAQPQAIAAAGAGGGCGGLAAWSKSITIEATLSAGSVYYYAAGWSALSPTVGTRAAIAVCTAVVAGPPDTSTLLLGGEFARSGTPGAPLYAGAAGALTETFTGDQNDETMAAPWVWHVGWQITADTAILIPCDPYRPRALTYCLADGLTQLVITTREYPEDPA